MFLLRLKLNLITNWTKEQNNLLFVFWNKTSCLGSRYANSLKEFLTKIFGWWGWWFQLYRIHSLFHWWAKKESLDWVHCPRTYYILPCTESPTDVQTFGRFPSECIRLGIHARENKNWRFSLWENNQSKSLKAITLKEHSVHPTGPFQICKSSFPERSVGTCSWKQSRLDTSFKFLPAIGIRL